MNARRLLRSMPWILGVVALAPATAAAQTCNAATPAGNCTASTTTTMTAGTILQLSLSASSTILTPPGTAGYDAGFVADNGPTTTVKCNRSWTLKVAAAGPFWTATNTTPGVTARANKPASDLQWSSSPAGPFVGTAVAGATLKSGSATGGTSTTIYYRTQYAWLLDTPGTYALVVIMTLSAP